MWQNKKKEIQEYIGGSFIEIDEKLKEIEDAKENYGNIDVANGNQVGDCVMDYPHAVISEVLPASGAKLPADYALQDPHDYLEVLGHIIPGAIKNAGINASDIIGVGIDFTCCTLIPVRADGTPLCFEEKYKNDF